MLRSQVREEIFKIIFRIPFAQEGELEEQIIFALESLQGKSEANLQYIKNKTMDIKAHLPEIDAKITQNCEGWSINRIGKAEIAVMRIAVYEMLYEEDIPAGVTINEAVELTKNYCDEDAKGFVNAVLAKVEKSLG